MMLKAAIPTAELLQNMTDTIVSEVDPEKGILFGSQARGEAHQHSDVDLLIVENTPFGVKRSRRKEAAKVLLEAALRDLRALYGMLDRDTFADEICGFHVQQTAEKVLKAWLSYFAVDFPHTHLFQELEALKV